MNLLKEQDKFNIFHSPKSPLKQGRMSTTKILSPKGGIAIVNERGRIVEYKPSAAYVKHFKHFTTADRVGQLSLKQREPSSVALRTVLNSSTLIDRVFIYASKTHCK